MWKTIERPGHFGKQRDKKHQGFDQRFGVGNWRVAWQWGDDVLGFPFACLIYEDAYFIDSYRREYFWQDLVKHASDVFDYQPSDVESGLDYLIQKAQGTHLQDIAVRRVLKRRGQAFQGNDLIQIRSHDSYWGANFSPGRVQFHIPEMIVKPQLQGWWGPDSVEDFWQSNKVLQTR